MSDERVSMTLRLPVELKERLRQAADDRVVGVSLLVQRAIEGYLDQLGESFTCPRCRRTSYNRNDIRDRYCGNCHWWTGDPLLGLLYTGDAK